MVLISEKIDFLTGINTLNIYLSAHVHVKLLFKRDILPCYKFLSRA